MARGPNVARRTFSVARGPPSYTKQTFRFFPADRVSLSYLQVASTRLAHDDSRAHSYLIAAIR